MTTGTTTSTGANTITITVTATGTSTGTGTTTAATIPSPSPSAPTPTPVPPPFAFDLRCNFEASQQKTQSGPIVLFSDDRVINMSEQVHEHPLFGNPNHRPAGVRGEIATITNPANPLYGKAYELFTSVKTDKPGMDALNIVTGSNSTSTIHMKGEAGNTNFSNVVGSCGPAKTTIIHEVLPTHYEISCEGTRDLGSDRAVFKTSSVVQVGKPAIMASIYKDITLKNEWIFNIKAPVKAGKMNVAELGLMENRGAIADLNDGKSWDASITLPSSHGSQFRFMAQRLLPKVQPSDPEQTEELVVNCKAEAK